MQAPALGAARHSTSRVSGPKPDGSGRTPSTRSRETALSPAFSTLSCPSGSHASRTSGGGEGAATGASGVSCGAVADAAPGSSPSVDPQPQRRPNKANQRACCLNRSRMAQSLTQAAMTCTFRA